MRATSRPMPRAEPVTNAVLPSSVKGATDVCAIGFYFGGFLEQDAILGESQQFPERPFVVPRGRRWLHSSSGRGSAWLERLVRDQEVGGSNPLAPTIYL